MANINTAQTFIKEAHATEENLVTRAGLAIAAQRCAKQSRASTRNDVAWQAHNIIAAALMRAKDHRDRSIIGNIMAESRMIGWTF